jgi:DNA-binding protein WhiA
LENKFLMKQSYSSKVKEELLNIIPSPNHCRIAEAAGLFSMNGEVVNDPVYGKCYKINGDERVCNKYFTLVKKTNILGEYDCGLVDESLLKKPCCRSAYLRGVFLARGSITDPEKTYHLEIIAKSKEQAKQIIMVMATFSITGKLINRMDRYVIYLKESGSISDMLACMGASVAMLDFENIRVVKEMKNNVNRKVNCETANIGKMVDAAVREINDIKLIDETYGLESLSQKLQETARLRLEHPEMPLKELGEMHNPPVGKSGVNHRLRRIAKIALDIKDQEESKQS